MLDEPPRPPLQPPSMGLLTLYGEATAALARLAEIRRLSPARQALITRQRLLELSSLAWVDGEILDMDRLVAGTDQLAYSVEGAPLRWIRAFGRPLAREAFADGDAVLDWLGVQDVGPVAPFPPLSTYPTRSETRLRMSWWCERFEAGWEGPPALAGAAMAHAWRSSGFLGRGDALAAVLLGDRWGPGAMGLSSGGLVASGLRQQGPAWIRAQRGEAPLRTWLAAIVGAVEQLGRLEQQLSLYQQRVDLAVEGKRRHSKLADLLALAQEAPAITAQLAQRRLRLSYPGARALIAQAEEKGLLVEKTGRASYRRYAIPLMF